MREGGRKEGSGEGQREREGEGILSRLQAQLRA